MSQFCRLLDTLFVEGSIDLETDLDRIEILSLRREEVTIKYLNSSVKTICSALGKRGVTKS